MKRILAFMFDTVWMTIVLTLLWYIGQQILQIRIPYTVFATVGATALFSIMEYGYKGQTPGRFLSKIQLKTESLEYPAAHQIVGRASLLAISGSTITIVLDIIGYVMFAPEIASYMFYYSGIAIGFLILIPMGFTWGQQGFHDYVFRTVVLPINCVRTYRLSRQGILTSVLVVAIGGVLYGAFMRTTTGRLIDENGASIYLATGIDSSRDFHKWIPPASTINDGIDYPERFYVSHGFFGFRNKWSIDIDWSRAPVRPGHDVAFYRINLTPKGWLDQWYQREAINNLVHFTNGKRPGTPVLVELVSILNFLDIVLLDFRQKVVAIPLSSKTTDQPAVGSVIPEDGSSMTIHFALGGRFPGWMSAGEGTPSMF